MAKLGIDVTPLGGRRTGVGQYTLGLLQHLPAAVEDWELRAFSTGLRRPALPFKAPHKHLLLPTRGMYKVWNAFGRPRVDRMLGGVDVYHATNYFLPPVEMAKRVLTVYDLAFLKEPAWASPKIVGPFSEHIKRFANEADAVITISEASKADVVHLLGTPAERVHVVYGAADERFAPKDRGKARNDVALRYGIEDPFLLFVSTLEPRKNVAGMLEAFKLIAKEVPHKLVLIGGEGWSPVSTDSMLAQLDLDRDVIRPGYVPAADLPIFYNAADAFVLASHYEGFGLPALEAMQCGCPAVLSNTSSLPEVGGEAARYAAPHDIPELAKQLKAVLSDAQLQAEMRSAGLEQAKKFSWAQSAQDTVAVYRSVLS